MWEEKNALHELVSTMRKMRSRLHSCTWEAMKLVQQREPEMDR